jgi:DNA modification methylase
LAPLQLEVIRRCIRLWSSPGDLVWDPFGGIGSTGVVALQEGRRAVLAELKSSYFEQAVRNLRAASAPGQQTFDIGAE